MSDLIDFNVNVTVTVKIIVDPPSYPPPIAGTVSLNLTNNLLIIRQELENEKFIDNPFLFSKKYREDNNNNINYRFSEIKLEEEEDYLLDEIIEIIDEDNILYLKEPYWKRLNKLLKLKLEYGCIMTFDGIKKADRSAFEMRNCELTNAEECRKGKTEFKSIHDRIMANNLFFSTDINKESLEKLGISIGNIGYEEVNSENISYRFTEYSKVSLKFGNHLTLTQEFIDEVGKAIESGDFVEKFKRITEQYGQFIPTIVILGGRANYDITSTRCSALIGGEQSNFENFDEKAWLKSLENYENWGCIELQGLINIFQSIPDDLRKKIFEYVGKRIRHLDFVEVSYNLEEFGKPKIFEFKEFKNVISSNILNIIQNKEADCNVFATVIDMAKSGSDFFTCQIYCPPDGVPSLIIHCIQKKFKRRQCKLKIGWMVIGYYTDFNFILSDIKTQLKILKSDFSMSNNQPMIDAELSLETSFNDIPLCLGSSVLTKLDSSNNSLVIGYHFFNAQEENKIGACTFSYSLKEKQCVNLPKFTFYTLIISNYHAYSIIPFNSLLNRLYINIDNNTTEPCIITPKFISLYFTQRTNYGPICLKQKSEKIKSQIIKCRNGACFICRNRTIMISKDSVKCVFFDPLSEKIVIT